VCVGTASSYNDRHNWYAAAAVVVCVWPCHLFIPMQIRRPSDRLMVHSMLTLAVKLWLGGTTRV